MRCLCFIKTNFLKDYYIIKCVSQIAQKVTHNCLYSYYHCHPGPQWNIVILSAVEGRQYYYCSNFDRSGEI